MVQAIKTVGDYELDVLGIPFGSPDERDSDGEYFRLRQNFILRHSRRRWWSTTTVLVTTNSPPGAPVYRARREP